ncbi:MAG: LamG-like jellyroll fold domain-containing protein, partial [Chitinophagales bacterium]
HQQYRARLRTSTSSNNGTPDFIMPNSLITSLQHVVFTRDANGNTAIYVDGILKDSDFRGGNFSTWNNGYQFALANELSNNRAWKGEFHRIAIYDRAITAMEITDNFFATAACDQETPEACVETNLVALYDFAAGSGSTVQDVSGFGSPLNLSIQHPANTQWIAGGGLSINNATTIQSSGAATKIINACKATNEITIEAWVRPNNLTQNGPARIATISKDTGNRNTTLGQDGNDYVARLRTTTTNNNGMPNFTASDDAIIGLQHVVFTKDASGNTFIYVDGVEADSDHRSGTFNNWDNTYKLALANELSNNRAWKGDLYRIGIYDRALKAAEVQQNFFSGFKCSNEETQCTTTDVVALYNFKEGIGNTVYDVSGFNAPLNLNIANTSNATWLPGGGLDVHSPTIIQSAAAASKITTACKATNEVTIEAWVRPDNLTQNGPARIATLSQNTGNRNFTLGQDGDDYVGRLRTTTTNNNGMPNLTAHDDAQTTLQHVVFTRDTNGNTRMYVNGALVHGDTRTGNFSNWDSSYKFALANELSNDRAWKGTYYRVAVYNRALNSAQVNQNYFAGFDCEDAPVANCNMSESVLFVVGNASLNSSDASIKSRLESMGHSVTVKDDDAVQVSDGHNRGLIVISSTVHSSKVNTKFRDTNVPVILWEAWLYDDMKMTSTSQGTDYGSAGSQTQVQINNSTHPITNGFIGNVSVMNNAQTFYWGKPNSAASLATLNGQSNKSVIFAYDLGDQMVGMNAPGRRVGLFLNNSSATQMTNHGINLFEAAVNWATNHCDNNNGNPCAQAVGFTSQDISASLSGSSCYDASTGTHTIEAAGNDIWNAADEFRYVYQSFSGNGEIVARVSSLVQTDNWAKAGVMMRESLSDDSKHASMFVTAVNGTAFQYRSGTGSNSSHVSGGSSSIPYWVKLERIGNTFKAYKSSNGTNWSLVGTQTISMASTIYIGLAATSHNTGTLTTATIDNVSINGVSKTTVNSSIDAEVALNAYPNPFVEHINVYFKGAISKEPVLFSIYTLDGRLVFEESVESNAAGIAEHQLTTSDLISGTYLLVAQGSQERQTMQVVKLGE